MGWYVTLELTCDGGACFNIFEGGMSAVGGNNPKSFGLAEAKRDAREEGWKFKRDHGKEISYCPACATEIKP